MEDIKLQIIVDTIDDYIQKVIELVVGKAFREAASTFGEREELKVAVRNFIEEKFGESGKKLMEANKKLKDQDSTISNLLEIIDIKNEEIENLKHQIAPTH